MVIMPEELSMHYLILMDTKEKPRFPLLSGNEEF